MNELDVLETAEQMDSLQLTKDEMQKTLLFEIAWEVCNQVGGIYTVIRSKLPSVINKWGNDNYVLLGPYFPNQIMAELEPIYDFDTPVGKVVEMMRDSGFDVYYGKWLVTGKPNVVLFNLNTISEKLGIIKYELWKNHYIPTPGHDDLLNKVLLFGYQITEFFKLLVQIQTSDKQIIAHFHEWMAGTPIPELRRLQLPMKIVFTTHATLLGRYLAMNDPSFYDNLPYYNWEYEAKNFNIEALIRLERAAAHGAHIFSTVSDITGKECIYLLGRKPDVILPNGLNIERYEALHRFQNLHLESKEKINEFVMGHFFQSYSFDLEKTLYFFTSGRFEFQNKGFDLTLEALSRLNWKMKVENIDATVVMFFITRNPYHAINTDVLESKMLLEQIRRDCNQIINNMTDKFFNAITAGSSFKLPDFNEMVEEYSQLRLRRTVQTWRSKRLPYIVTHNLQEDATDPILVYLRNANLINYPWDKVKVVYHPDFLTAANPLFRMEYSSFVRGCHLGVFPSYYEPWGYTPLECMASGIPSITSDLAGFGSYVQNHMTDMEENGIYLVKRYGKNYFESAEELANQMLAFVKQNRRERISQRNKVEEASVQFDWNELGRYYDIAYKMAVTME